MRGDGGRRVSLADPRGLLPCGRAPHVSASAVDHCLQSSLNLEVGVLKIIQNRLGVVQYFVRSLEFLAFAKKGRRTARHAGNEVCLIARDVVKVGNR
ncbi:MAG TPA: hypothetical protein VIF02_02775 [Methylocella sp.]